ncbi:hypothetical protein B0H13DRAFT_2348148 [Mycena leptocephala]|nr:hypothetical protein B0H13DRAFT_2348148 [Mycena leptocephala]
MSVEAKCGGWAVKKGVKGGVPRAQTRESRKESPRRSRPRAWVDGVGQGVEGSVSKAHTLPPQLGASTSCEAICHVPSNVSRPTRWPEMKTTLPSTPTPTLTLNYPNPTPNVCPLGNGNEDFPTMTTAPNTRSPPGRATRMGWPWRYTLGAEPEPLRRHLMSLLLPFVVAPFRYASTLAPPHHYSREKEKGITVPTNRGAYPIYALGAPSPLKYHRKRRGSQHHHYLRLEYPIFRKRKSTTTGSSKTTPLLTLPQLPPPHPPPPPPPRKAPPNQRYTRAQDSSLPRPRAFSSSRACRPVQGWACQGIWQGIGRRRMRSLW